MSYFLLTVVFCLLCFYLDVYHAQSIFNRYNLMSRLQMKPRIKARLQEKLNQYRQRSTETVCYDTVGCFDLPHKRSPLQKVPEDPEMLRTKFYLLRRDINFSTPQIIHYDDDGESLKNSKFNYSQPLKMIIHGYMSRWNEKGALIASKAYLDLYDCNMMAVDWGIGARGPQYTTAAANTELVGRQTGILLLKIIRNGMDPKNIHLIGFSLGAHVAGSASEVLKASGHLLGRITGLDAASPLFRNNHLREKHKKLDRDDAHFVDVVHTDSSPFATDGFGLWEPIGHVDFFPNGGQDQPGCTDTRGSIVLTSFDKTLTREIACSHIRAWHLFQETLLNKVAGKNNSCEFISYSCPGGLPSFERGHCFPHLDNPKSKLYLDPSYRTEIGKLGEDAKGEGVMYLTTRSSSTFCDAVTSGIINVLNEKLGVLEEEEEVSALNEEMRHLNISHGNEIKTLTNKIEQQEKKMLDISRESPNNII
ncbi:pancreatic lipase-related protein 2-like [Coccinella septempunctata]|uniref:pancreatic lipase-related protein 2-like n=1 Tax=Coccinella septempunctata TaxID=41139 RepID=UPI001D0741E4|nr:pancreatic lipase-related protein 2-like [Coccinella septempunctata]